MKRTTHLHPSAGLQPAQATLKTAKRNLPHWQLGGSTYFLTFRLHSSVSPHLNMGERAGVKHAILHWHHKKWRVHVLTVMPDHAHVLASPLQSAPTEWYSLSAILHSVKWHSARQINLVRERRGKLWQAETYDRIVRDEAEFDEKSQYILVNALKRGLVKIRGCMTVFGVKLWIDRVGAGYKPAPTGRLFLPLVRNGGGALPFR